ncbi:MAG: hypothetical protein K0S65_6790, partial [Labilithrix sp.]|nr:hypothetical protein [Labilithrix sp.]
TVIVLGAGVTIAAVACRGSSAGRAPSTTTPTLTGAELGSSSNDDAVMRVATARCERELACNKIGQGRAYEDQPSCLERMGELMDQEAGKLSCPPGVDPFAVSACLFDIQKTPCGGALEQSSNLPSCTKSALCIR